MYEFSPGEKAHLESLKIPLAIYEIIDGRAVALLVSDGLCELRNVNRENLINSLTNCMFAFVHPDDIGRIARVGMDFAAHKCEYNMVYRVRRGVDENSCYHLSHTIGKWQKMENGAELAFLYYIDLNDSKEQINQLTEDYCKLQRDLLYQDLLTGLPNLKFFYDFGPDKVKNFFFLKQKPVVILFDIKDMLTYNSEYGFYKGDELFRIVAAKLKETFPCSLIAKAYNDQFLVIAQQETACENVKKLNLLVNQELSEKATCIRGGIAPIEENMDLMDAVDNARRCIREMGSDLTSISMIYTKEIDDEFLRQRYIVDNLDDALSRNRIKVYYQPIIRTNTEKLCSLEALARWDDPEKGLMEPMDFIPVLEKYHLIHKLDLYMLEQVCKEVWERKSLGLEMVPVSVNLAGLDFDHVDMAEELNQIVGRYKVPHDLIVIEITEQTIATASDIFRKQLEEIRSNGFRLWIDDFGSGYSSLNVFSRYKFDLIKFDMELMKHLDDNNGANRHVMKAIVEISKAMGIHTLAEGVESQEGLDFLKEIGCNRAQGFLFRPPEPLKIIKEWRGKIQGHDAKIETEEEAEDQESGEIA